MEKINNMILIIITLTVILTLVIPVFSNNNKNIACQKIGFEKYNSYEGICYNETGQYVFVSTVCINDECYIHNIIKEEI